MAINKKKSHRYIGHIEGLRCVLCLFVFFPIVSLAQEILELGNRRELFVDHSLIEQIDNLQLELHAPREEGAVLFFDKSWEGPFSGYCTVIHDGESYKAYYRGLPVAGQDGSGKEVSCYAESDDGIHWRKPDLGLYEIQGSKANNIILAHAAPVTHNFSPFLDTNPAAIPQQRYKALGGTKKSGLIAYGSPDGIHWKKLQEKAVFTQGIFDSQNVSFWSEAEQLYVCYFRTWTGEGYQGFRSVSRTTSPNFLDWSEPVAMSFGDTPYEHMYTQQTHPYYRASHIYVAIGARFMAGRQVITDEEAVSLDVNPKYYKDCSDAFFMTSRGGSVYDRSFMESFIRPGIGLENWVSRSNYPALNVVQTSPTEMSVYVNEHYAQPSAHLKRYSMRIDGFASLSAGYEGGELLTKPFTFEGKQLELNFESSAAGGIRIEIQDETGTAISGFRLSDAQEIIGNQISRLAQWNGQSDVSALVGKAIRLRFVMKDADLYSFRFVH